jgi:hypothetical protein
MAGPRLFFCRRNDPYVVAELSGDAFQQSQAAGVHAVVVREENAHQTPMGERPLRCNCEEKRAIFATAWRFLHCSFVSSC